MELQTVAAVVPQRHTATSAHVFLQTLVDAGVTTAFGIPGGTASPLFDALRSIPGLHYVATRHEAGAAFAALGHARATGRPAVVLTTSGPGVTNTMTAVASAHYENIPLIVVSGEVPMRAYGRGALQDGTSHGWRAIEVMRPVTRFARAVSNSRIAASVALAAYDASTSPRPGPAFVSMPLDVGGEQAPLSRTFPASTRQQCEVDRNACRTLVRFLSEASRPLLVLGAGARGASDEAVQLAERLALPVAVTAHAKGAFPERHPQYLGVIGIGQHPSVNEYLSVPPDVSLVVGSGLDDLATNGWTLPLLGTAASFQIDRDVEALGRSMPFSHHIVGDATRVLETALGFLPSDVARPRRRGPGLRKVRPEQLLSNAVPLKPPRVLRALEEAFPGALWCPDIGEHLAYALHYLEVDSPEEFSNFLGFGSMGSGIGASVGLQMARPERQVVCVCGDGGFAMMLGELITCVEQRLGIVFAVMNDGRWNMVEHGFRAVYGAAPGGFASAMADYAGVARAMGAVGVTIATPEDLLALRLRSHIKPGVPLVLDVRIDAEEALTPTTRAASISHFCAEAS